MPKLLGVQTFVTTVEVIKATGGSSANPSTQITNWTIASDTANGVLSYSSGTWTATKKCNLTATFADSGQGTNSGPRFKVNGTQIESVTNPSAGQELFLSGATTLNIGDTFTVFGSAGSANLIITATAFNY